MKSHSLWMTLIVAALGAALAGRPAAACTGIRLKSKDGAVIYARTLEFAVDLQSNVLVIPKDPESWERPPATNPVCAGRRNTGSWAPTGSTCRPSSTD